MHPERDRTGECQRIRRDRVEYVGEWVRGIGKRRVKLGVPVLDRQRQDDGLHAGKAGARVIGRGAAFRRMPLKRKGTDRVAVGVQERGKMGLPDISADDRKGRGLRHIQNLLCAILCGTAEAGETGIPDSRKAALVLPKRLLVFLHGIMAQMSVRPAFPAEEEHRQHTGACVRADHGADIPDIRTHAALLQQRGKLPGVFGAVAVRNAHDLVFV